MEYLTLFALFVLGLAVGSFLNVLIYRFSERENLTGILKGRSYCPNCKTPIKWYDNIPLISYLVLKGRCRHCGWRIPLRYPLVELIGGITPVVVYLLYADQGWLTVFSYTLMVYILLVISLIDWKTFEVPDTLSLGGLVVGLALSFFRPDITPTESFIAALIGAGVVVLLILLYYFLKGIVPLGLGDAKVLAMVGAFEGYVGVYCSLLLGAIFALLFFLPQVVRNRSLQFAVPFVPFLSLGAVIGLLCRKWGILSFLYGGA